MTEAEIWELVEPIALAARQRFAETSQAVASIEARLDDLEKLSSALESRAGAISDGGDRLAAGAIGMVDAKLDPIDEKLKECLVFLGTTDLAIQSPDQRLAEVRTAITGLVDDTLELISQVPDVTDSVIAPIEKAVSDATEHKDKLTSTASDALGEAGDAVDRLVDSLGQQIPAVADPIAKLIDETFGEQLTEMAEDADAVLSAVESLVEKAGSTIETALGSITNILEQINKIVQPLDPAFDAFEILS